MELKGGNGRRMKQKGIINRLTIYFMNGLVIILPAMLTFLFFRYIYSVINHWGIYWLQIPKGWQFPGLGLLLLILMIILVGAITQLWIARKLVEKIEGFVERIPLVKELYVTLKDTLHAIMGEKKSFDNVVLVATDSCKRMGFLTVKHPIFKTADNKEYLGVYFPQSMQLSGDLYWVEKEKVEFLEISVEEALRIILSAGVASNKNAVIKGK